MTSTTVEQQPIGCHPREMGDGRLIGVCRMELHEYNN